MKSLTLSLLLFACTIFCHATVITIPDDFVTIQEGIDAATSGDTISVQIGTYNEKLTIDKAVSLIGEAANATIIQGNDTGTVVSVTSSYVEIKRFTISGSGDYHYEEMSWDAAIKLIETDSCVIESCRLIENGGAGIALSGTSHTRIRYNQIEKNYGGIYFFEDQPYSGNENSYNEVIYNHINDNDYRGVIFEHSVDVHHRYNTVAFNEISRNANGGLSMIMCMNNTIIYNQFSFNLFCFSYSECMGGGGENVFHHNVFESPTVDSAKFYFERFDGTNQWNVISPCTGNYWADYAGENINGDGIGDYQHYIGGFDHDYCPIMQYVDTDSDGVTDTVDNCPWDANANQSDLDRNGVGDICEDFICGDANNDELINIGDAVSLINFIFKQGPSPVPYMAGDANCDEDCNIGDAVYLVNHIFNGGPEPCCP